MRLTLVIMALYALAAPAAGIAQDTATGNPYARFEFSMDNEFNLPVVTNFSLAGLRLPALLDLGAEALVVDSATFDYLGLHTQHRAEAVSASGARYSRPASVVNITSPGTTRTVILDIVANDSLLNADSPFSCILPRSLVRTDKLAVLGSRSEIYLYSEPCPTLPFDPNIGHLIPGAQAVSIWETGSGLMVPVLIDGADLYFFKLDTGASVSSINAKLAEAHPGLVKPTGGHDSVVVSNGLPQLRRRLEVMSGVSILTHQSHIPLDGLTVQEDTSVPPGLPKVEPDETWPNFMAPAGTLGMDFLGQYDLVIDFEHHVLLLWDGGSTPVLLN